MGMNTVFSDLFKSIFYVELGTENYEMNITLLINHTCNGRLRNQRQGKKDAMPEGHCCFYYLFIVVKSCCVPKIRFTCSHPLLQAFTFFPPCLKHGKY